MMRLVGPRTGLMECKVCGAQHWANVRPNSNGKYYRGSWQCQNDCKPDAAHARQQKEN